QLDERARRPRRLFQIFAGDDPPAPLQYPPKDLERLLLQPDAFAVLPYLTRSHVYLKTVEPEPAGRWGVAGHVEKLLRVDANYKPEGWKRQIRFTGFSTQSIRIHGLICPVKIQQQTSPSQLPPTSQPPHIRARPQGGIP